MSLLDTGSLASGFPSRGFPGGGSPTAGFPGPGLPGLGTSDAGAGAVTGRPRLWGFPPPERVPQLRWLGTDYAAQLSHDLEQGLGRQDPGTRVIAVKCEGSPLLKTASVDAGGVIRAHDAAFSLEILLCDGAGRSWRLRGRWTYVGRNLGTAAAHVTHYWELFTADQV